MAKWGEGDPRWIVEERPDATNVNNWHWTERNASQWSMDRLKELFKDVPVESSVADLKVTETEKVEGEASANNRKGKLIFFYEWNLILKWEGRLNGGSGKLVEGKVNIPNLSEENDISEVEITVTIKSSDEESELLKEIMHSVGKEVIRKKLAQYVSGLKEEFSKGMILPKKEETKGGDVIKNLSSGFNKQINVTAPTGGNVTNNKTNVVKIETTTLKLPVQTFQCKAQEFYDAMTKVEMVTAFTRGAVKIDPTKGGEFRLFGGSISGFFDELVPAKRIVQRWRVNRWPDGHFSTVTIDIDEKSDCTDVTLVQTGVPTAEADVTRENWERYYWDSLKRTFGFGVFFDYT